MTKQPILTLREFHHRLDKGEQLYLEPYFSPKVSSRYREIMVWFGVGIERLIDTTEEIVQCALLDKGYAEERYEEWAKNGNRNIRERLAEYGKCPEILIHDTSAAIRATVVHKQPDYAKYLKINNDQEWLAVYQILNGQVDPEPELLKRFITLPAPKTLISFTLRGLKLKASALNTQRTLLDTSMTPWQHYQNGNPLWTTQLTGNQVSKVLGALERKDDSEAAFVNTYTEVIRKNK